MPWLYWRCGTEGDDAFGAQVVAVGFPFIYCLWLALLWQVGDMALTVDRSFTAGPYKDLQLKLARGPMVWFCNATAIILPAIALIVALLVICGLTPWAPIPQNALSNAP